MTTLIGMPISVFLCVAVLILTQQFEIVGI